MALVLTTKATNILVVYKYYLLLLYNYYYLYMIQNWNFWLTLELGLNPYIPEVEGLNTFTGEVLHSTQFKSGKDFKNKNVLVVGSGNSGMEIALDLANHGAKTSIIVRSLVWN